MSRIFKSNYVKIGIPKTIKSNTPNIPIIKKTDESLVKGDTKKQSLEEQANNIIEDAKQMYLRIIEEANLEAQKITNNANQEKEALLTDAANQGYNDGYNAGYSEGIDQAEDIIQKAVDIKGQLEQRLGGIYAEAEAEIMGIVLDIANKVMCQELVQNHEIIFSLIRQALDKCAFKDKLTIRVSYLDYDYVNKNKDRIIMLTEGINELEIQNDKALPKGSCIIETPSGEINAGINVQMKELQKAFEYTMRNE